MRNDARGKFIKRPPRNPGRPWVSAFSWRFAFFGREIIPKMLAYQHQFPKRRKFYFGEHKPRTYLGRQGQEV